MRAIAALTVLVMLGCAGCGLQNGAPTGHQPPARHPTRHRTTTPSPSHSPEAPVNLPVSCVHLGSLPGRRTVSLTNADNHESFCVLRGAGIFVLLRESSPEPWAPIQSNSRAVERRPSGLREPAAGGTGAFFEAVEVGTATLTSFEPRCPGGPHPGGHSGGRCPPPLRFAVTVHVLGFSRTPA